MRLWCLASISQFKSLASLTKLQFGGLPLNESLDEKGTGERGMTTLGRDGAGHARLEAPRGLTGEEYASVRDGKSAVFVYGTINYKDVFGRSWWTTYRYYIGGDQGIRADGFMAGHPDGNRAS